MKVNDLIMNELSEEKSTELWLQLRKDSAEFDDLCDARDEIVRVLASVQIQEEALQENLIVWDKKLVKMYRTLSQ